MYDNDAYVYDKINEDLREAGLPVKAEDIIDIIGGYHLPGYGTPAQEDLGRYQPFFSSSIMIIAYRLTACGSYM